MGGMNCELWWLSGFLMGFGTCLMIVGLGPLLVHHMKGCQAR